MASITKIPSTGLSRLPTAWKYSPKCCICMCVYAYIWGEGGGIGRVCIYIYRHTRGRKEGEEPKIRVSHLSFLYLYLSQVGEKDPYWLNASHIYLPYVPQLQSFHRRWCDRILPDDAWQRLWREEEWWWYRRQEKRTKMMIYDVYI